MSKRYLKVQGIQEVSKDPGFAGGWGTDKHRHTHRHTHRHINTMTRPGLGAGPSENHPHVNLNSNTDCAGFVKTTSNCCPSKTLQSTSATEN